MLSIKSVTSVLWEGKIQSEWLCILKTALDLHILFLKKNSKVRLGKRQETAGALEANPNYWRGQPLS